MKREFMGSFISPTDVDSLLDYLFGVSDLVEVPFRLRPVLRDPDDDRILELAARAGASIVTFNTRDFVGALAYGVAVVQPVKFLQQIGESR